MPQRPAKCYSHTRRPPYTRRKYMRGVPGSKIRSFDMGKPNEDFPVKVALISLEKGQIRHIALEAARIAANAYLNKHIMGRNFHLRINVKPHQVIRENKMMAFAGADRLQAGMRRSFGKPAGTAARVAQKQVLVYARVTPDNIKIAQGALNRAGAKFPVKCNVKVVQAPPELQKKYGLITS